MTYEVVLIVAMALPAGIVTTPSHFDVASALTVIRVCNAAREAVPASR